MTLDNLMENMFSIRERHIKQIQEETGKSFYDFEDEIGFVEFTGNWSARTVLVKDKAAFERFIKPYDERFDASKRQVGVLYKYDLESLNYFRIHKMMPEVGKLVMEYLNMWQPSWFDIFGRNGYRYGTLKHINKRIKLLKKNLLNR